MVAFYAYNNTLHSGFISWVIGSLQYFHVEDMLTFLSFSTHVYCSTWTRTFPGLGLMPKFRQNRDCLGPQVWLHNLRIKCQINIIIINKSTREKTQHRENLLQAYLAYKTFLEGREILAGRRLLLPECVGRVEKWGSWAEACDPGPAEQIGSRDQREA